jgi:hypothetical protein
MKSRRISTKLIVTSSALLLLGTTIGAITQRESTQVTRVRVCVKENGQLRMITSNDSTCGPSEQLMEWEDGDEVTEIQLGAGLIGDREGGSVQLAVDPNLIQSCTSCDNVRVFAGFNDGPEPTPSGADAPNHGDPLPEIGVLPLPQGKYLMQAKLWIQNTSDNRLFARCKLSAGSDFDWVQVTVREHDSAALALTVVHDFDAPGGRAIVGCSDNQLGSGTQWNDLKITAFAVPDISNVFLGSN